jgi:aryl-alcohol dehydrogenase-like predicted oxidoreductase
MTWPPTVLIGASRIGLGLAALGRPAYITTGRDIELGSDRRLESMRGRTEEVLDAAYAAGVRYIDVARSYGFAESFLAGWLARRQVEPTDIAVGSKWGYTYVGDWRLDAERHEVQDLSAAAFARQLAESRALLGAHLSLYQVHSATRQNNVLSSPTVLEALRRVREGGLSVEPSSASALARAHAAGMTVIVKEAVANGRLTSSGDQPAAVAAAAERGMTADALAISAALAQPWADIVLSGAVTVDMLRHNLAAASSGWDDDLAHLAARLVMSPEVYWTERSQRSWT